MLQKMKKALFFVLAIIGLGCITPTLNAWRGRWGGYGYRGGYWGPRWGVGWRRPWGWGYGPRYYRYGGYYPASRTVYVESQGSQVRETTVQNNTKQTLYVESSKESRNIAPGERIVIRGRTLTIEGERDTLRQREYGSSVEVTEDTEGKLRAR